MPKSGDDLLAPTFIEEVMAVLEDPTVAMCHAGAVVIDGEGKVLGEVPAETRLATPEEDAIARAAHVMETYTFVPSFWGICRRSALLLSRSHERFSPHDGRAVSAKSVTPWSPLCRA